MSFLLYLSNDDGGIWYFFPANPLEKLNCSRPLLSMTIQINSLCGPVPNSQNSLFVYNILLICAKTGVSSKYCEGFHVSAPEIFMRVSHLLFSTPPSASIPSLVNATLRVAAPLLFCAIHSISLAFRRIPMRFLCSAPPGTAKLYRCVSMPRGTAPMRSFASQVVPTLFHRRSTRCCSFQCLCRSKQINEIRRTSFATLRTAPLYPSFASLSSVSSLDASPSLFLAIHLYAFLCLCFAGPIIAVAGRFHRISLRRTSALLHAFADLVSAALIKAIPLLRTAPICRCCSQQVTASHSKSQQGRARP